jgi:hypothetical protein
LLAPPEPLLRPEHQLRAGRQRRLRQPWTESGAGRLSRQPRCCRPSRPPTCRRRAVRPRVLRSCTDSLCGWRQIGGRWVEQRWFWRICLGRTRLRRSSRSRWWAWPCCATVPLGWPGSCRAAFRPLWCERMGQLRPCQQYRLEQSRPRRWAQFRFGRMEESLWPCWMESAWSLVSSWRNEMCRIIWPKR